MPENDPGPFEVDRLSTVDAQISALANRAKDVGMLDPFLKSIKRVISRLRDMPLTWGDPLYHTRKEGGTVCRGIESLVVVQYVVFDEERLVCILKVEPLPGVWPQP